MAKKKRSTGSNSRQKNKTSLSVDLVRKASSYSRTSYDNEKTLIDRVISRPVVSIDKLSLTAPYSHELLSAADMVKAEKLVTNRVESLVKEDSKVEWSKSRDPNYKKAVLIRLDEGVVVYCAFCPRSELKNFYKISFNVTKVAPFEGDLKKLLCAIIGRKVKRVLSSDEIRLRKVEIALDLFGIEVNELEVTMSRARKKRLFEGVDKIESIYTGTNFGKGNGVIVYDKKVQVTSHKDQYGLAVIKSLPVGESWTRVEFRLGNIDPNISIKTITDLKVSLEKFRVFLLRDKFKDPFFKDAILLNGINKALAKLPPKERKIYEVLLNQSEISLNEDKLDEAITRALKKIRNFVLNF